MEIIAHRGSSHEAPENTVAAAELAWMQNADAVELDVHLSKDGKLVVIHDDDTKRTTGVRGLVREMDMAEITRLDAGSWKGARFEGEKIPEFGEYLALGPSRRRFFIEVKTGSEAVPELKACLERSKLSAAQAVIISFDLDVVKLSKEAMPQYKALWLVGYGRVGRHPKVNDLIATAQAAGLDGLNLSSRWPINEAFVQKLRDAGLGLWVWTVDSLRRARQLRAAGVDGIATNRPGWMRHKL
jgi:glycerophosphoryl diester phosphodiesterase